MPLVDKWLSITRRRPYRVALAIVCFAGVIFLAMMGFQNSDTVWSDTSLRGLSPEYKKLASGIWASVLVGGGAFASYAIATAKGKLIADD